MRPEAAAGAREARRRVCHCPGDGPRGPPPPRGPESPTPWRPWMRSPQDAEPAGTGNPPESGGDQQTSGSKGAFGFQHPVRVKNICRVPGRKCWPVSQCKPPFTSTTMRPIQMMKSKRMKPSRLTFRARRWQVQWKTAWEQRAEAYGQTQDGDTEDVVASGVRVCSPTVTLREALSAPHSNKPGLSPMPDPPHTRSWGQLLQDTLHFCWV
ncbi:protein ripply3 isoform X1 [Equus przewalskii]|uniref:Protein ripply3 n=1 Tax=Equus przewalskii TaxID=9798 RepID=A0ABM4MM16_EQUPR